MHDIENLNYEDLSKLEKHMLKLSKVCSEVNESLELILFHIQELENKMGGGYGEEENWLCTARPKKSKKMEEGISADVTTPDETEDSSTTADLKSKKVEEAEVESCTIATSE